MLGAVQHAIVLLALAVTGCDDGTIGKTPTVLLFDTPHWARANKDAATTKKLGLVQVREVSDSRALVMRFVSPDEMLRWYHDRGPLNPRLESWEHTVYRFDYGDRSLRQVEASAWDEAGEGACDPGARHAMPEGLEKEIDGRTIVCRAKGEAGHVTESKFRIREGKVITRARVSPDGRYIAVVSAAKYKRSIMPVFSYVGPAGQHYLQILTLPELTPVGETIAIPMTHDGKMFISCDGSYIVCVVDEKFEKICVIPVEIPEEKETQ